jgi:hypothetical protein
MLRVVAGWQGTPLDSNSSFTFIDALSRTYAFPSSVATTPSAASTCPPVLQDDVTLRPLFDVVHTALKGKARATDENEEGGDSDVLLVFEGLNSLAWSGAETDEVARLVRAVQQLSTKVGPLPLPFPVSSLSVLISSSF